MTSQAEIVNTITEKALRFYNNKLAYRFQVWWDFKRTDEEIADIAKQGVERGDLFCLSYSTPDKDDAERFAREIEKRTEQFDCEKYVIIIDLKN